MGQVAIKNHLGVITYPCFIKPAAQYYFDIRCLYCSYNFLFWVHHLFLPLKSYLFIVLYHFLRKKLTSFRVIYITCFDFLSHSLHMLLSLSLFLSSLPKYLSLANLTSPHLLQVLYLPLATKV